MSGEVLDKNSVRKLVVKLVMGGWTAKDEARFSKRFMSYVQSMYPSASVDTVQQGFALRGVPGVNCTASTEHGVWAVAARELAR